MGQNFLVDHAALLRIADAAALTLADTVVEVGPGPGLLTRELLARAFRVVAVEKDEGMARLLRAELSQFFPRSHLSGRGVATLSKTNDPKLGSHRIGTGGAGLTLIEGDMLGVPLESLLSGPSEPYKVVANLPYYVAAPILRRFLEAAAKPQCLVVLVQKEVAESIAAPPGDRGLLAIAVQYYSIPKLMGTIRAGSFFPAPKVDSAILRLDVREEPAVDVPAGPFFEVVKAALSARRKQIVNPLAQGLGMDKAAVRAALGRAGIAPQRRAESLTMPEWESLCRALGRTG